MHTYTYYIYIRIIESLGSSNEFRVWTKPSSHWFSFTTQ